MAEESGNAAEKRNRHAARASLACTRCKRAKRRCDVSKTSGGDRSCTSCRLKNEKCDLRIEDDKRRAKHRYTTKELQSRIVALEDFIRKGGSSDMPELWTADVEDLDSSNDANISTNAVPPEETASQREQSVAFEVANSPQQHLPNGIEGHNDGPSPLSHFRPLSSANDIREPVPESPTTRSAGRGVMAEGASGVPKAPSTTSEVSSRVMDEVTARAGGLKGHQPGEMQFFGATSIFYHGVENDTPQSSDASFGPRTSKRLSPSEVMAEAEPEPIVEHLLDLFFEWQASQLDVVDRSTFVLHRKMAEENGNYADRTFYSPALLYGILSLASLISPDRGVRRYSSTKNGFPGELFLDKAKALLDMEIGSSTTTTVQAALLIGSWYGAIGQTSLGWTYSGRPTCDWIFDASLNLSRTHV